MQADVTTFPCTACGAQLAFEPGATHLTCDKCGTTQPIPVRDEAIEEYDLEAALAGANRVDPRSIAVDSTEVRCEGCGAVSVLTGTADRCAFCDSPVVVVDDDTTILKPESVLPFGIQKKAAAAAFQGWIGSRWFAPNDLQQRAQQEAIDGVYLPYWTFDADARAQYRGERGEHYRETETYTDSEGEEREREVRKTAWTDVDGRVRHHFDDVLVCATESLPRSLTESLEPWDLAELAPFDPSFLAGFQAERYNIELPEGWSVAQKRMERVLRDDAERDIGGDEQRVHHLSVRHEAVTFKHTLLPLWISSYRYNGEVYRVVVNARTGAVSGDRPYSTVKIVFFVGVLVLLFMTFCGGFSCLSGMLGLAGGNA
jgi:Zn finger protein HypA/HybF involved in hydrogenase expression